MRVGDEEEETAQLCFSLLVTFYTDEPRDLYREFDISNDRKNRNLKGKTLRNSSSLFKRVIHKGHFFDLTSPTLGTLSCHPHVEVYYYQSGKYTLVKLSRQTFVWVP